MRDELILKIFLLVFGVFLLVCSFLYWTGDTVSGFFDFVLFVLKVIVIIGIPCFLLFFLIIRLLTVIKGKIRTVPITGIKEKIRTVPITGINEKIRTAPIQKMALFTGSISLLLVLSFVVYKNIGTKSPDESDLNNANELLSENVEIISLIEPFEVQYINEKYEKQSFNEEFEMPSASSKTEDTNDELDSDITNQELTIFKPKYKPDECRYFISVGYADTREAALRAAKRLLDENGNVYVHEVILGKNGKYRISVDSYPTKAEADNALKVWLGRPNIPTKKGNAAWVVDKERM